MFSQDPKKEVVKMLGVGCGDPGGVSQGISMFYDERIFVF